MAERIGVASKRLPHGAGLVLPAYATAGAAGMDVVAAEDCEIAVGSARNAIDGAAAEGAAAAADDGDLAISHAAATTSLKPSPLRSPGVEMTLASDCWSPPLSNSAN